MGLPAGSPVRLTPRSSGWRPPLRDEIARKAIVTSASKVLSYTGLFPPFLASQSGHCPIECRRAGVGEVPGRRQLVRAGQRDDDGRREGGCLLEADRRRAAGERIDGFVETETITAAHTAPPELDRAGKNPALSVFRRFIHLPPSCTFHGCNRLLKVQFVQRAIGASYTQFRVGHDAVREWILIDNRCRSGYCTFDVRVRVPLALELRDGRPK